MFEAIEQEQENVVERGTLPLGKSASREGIPEGAPFFIPVGCRYIFICFTVRSWLLWIV